MIAAALAALFPAGGVVEVRALADRFTHSGYFDDFAKLANAAEALDADPEVKGTYVTLNVVDPALLARRANRVKMRLTRSDPTTADADILRRRWLPIDLDPVRPSGVSSTDEEHAAALQRAETIARWLAEQGFSDPIMADSGNGAHLLYRIDLANDEAAAALVKRVLVTLDALFSDDAVTVDTANFNAARIWKLYGTTSRKGDHTPARPHRRAKILSVPEKTNIITIEVLQKVAGRLPIEAPPPAPKNGTPLELGAWLRDHGLGVRNTRPWQGGTLYALEDCPFSGAHHDGAFAVQFPSGAIYAGCHHASCGGGVQRWPELRDRYEPREKRARRKREEVPPPPPPVPPAPDPADREEAMEILTEGDPLAFLLDTFGREHVGDRIVAECLVMSLASQSVENTTGLHVSVSGNSGKGKSHACTTMLKQVPAAYRLAGTVSNKALYYHDNLRPGTVFLFDDVSLSDDLQEVLKAATANFRERIEHHTVSPDRKIQVCRLPERCVWWLARVEDPGDDQVMNRMLTVWIDDSLEQDERVLEHMKHAEAREAAEGDAEDPGLPVCRAMWEVLKEERLHVSIPYAERVQFSVTANRRNPGMLFDLIKASALLHRFQRERYDGGIRANREDFAIAARIYTAINGDSGGQETKLTKNEAAALETVAAMGWDQFTIKMLQDALGLSYHQVYRILHGYASRGSTYSGLLEKCPAISYFDTTVTEDAEGCAIRRREHLFSFDLMVYRQWARGAGVWIDDRRDGGEDRDRDDGPGPADSCNIAAGFQQDYSSGREDQAAQDDVVTDSTSTDRETRLSLSTRFQQNPHPPGGRDPHGSVGGCVCETRNVATDPVISTSSREKKDRAAPCCSLSDGAFRKLLQTAVKRKGLLQETLPGVLDHREFTRVSTDLGRCDVCAEGKAVHRSGDGQVVLCEGCFARLVREWNMGKGIS
ncbi:hypothetical protein E2N92_04010 [Methanofollis formosanus]|uniref:Uncharacterized protein n=1 Tax=Methanofollis formosanus TaxID=299308 RepID=A0A8G1EG04_9EURY|nr:hypothetical protein [Methanofollis formosanus]QYZ78646.1 hypothetical protein E2N92_04010 [Methanofollis formosanus]